LASIVYFISKRHNHVGADNLPGAAAAAAMAAANAGIMPGVGPDHGLNDGHDIKRDLPGDGKTPSLVEQREVTEATLRRATLTLHEETTEDSDHTHYEIPRADSLVPDTWDHELYACASATSTYYEPPIPVEIPEGFPEEDDHYEHIQNQYESITGASGTSNPLYGTTQDETGASGNSNPLYDAQDPDSPVSSAYLSLAEYVEPDFLGETGQEA